MVVEFDLHTHRSMRFDAVHLLGLNQPRTVRSKMQRRLGFARDEIIQSTFENPDHAPHACFGIMCGAKRFGECHLVEDRRHLIWSISHDLPSTGSPR